MANTPLSRLPTLKVIASLAALIMSPAAASGAVEFSAVAAGDMTATETILWTRTVEPASGQPVAIPLTAQLATDPAFRTVLFTFKGTTDPVRAGTLKIDATGLKSHTHYFYRFVSPQGDISPVGQFTTAPRDGDRVAVRFAFSGDTSGAWRPYPLMQRIGELKLDYFIFLGDTIYELASEGSPAAAHPFANPEAALADYRRKYLENIQPVRPGGTPGLRAMFAAQGNYTLLDNHELGNTQFVSGGAPVGSPYGKGVDATDSAHDVNSSCDFMNKTQGFAILLQAYLDFQPVRERRVSASGDCRSDGVWQLYFAQRWGAHGIFINVDDRSFRDIQMRKPGGGGDTGPRADNPGRTMLGKTQFAWLQRVLLDAQAKGVTWKFVAISSPIEPAGNLGLAWDDMKSWIGGYRAERNRLLKFVADNHIEHVVFLTTDDHLLRVQEVTYLPDPAKPNSRARVPGAFTIVAGPMGANEPDRFTAHDFATIKPLADKLAADERAAGLEPIGLRPDFPGLGQVYREGNPDADKTRQPADFYSPDTFNYVTLEVSADGRTLAVDAWGIDSYRANSFPEPTPASAPRRILGFRVQAR